MSRARPQNQPPSTPLSPHQRQQPTPTRHRTPNPRHRHRRPQKRTLTIKKRTIKCRPFLVALFATPFHFFHPAPSPIIPLLPIYLIILNIFISLGFSLVGRKAFISLSFFYGASRLGTAITATICAVSCYNLPALPIRPSEAHFQTASTKEKTNHEPIPLARYRQSAARPAPAG